MIGAPLTLVETIRRTLEERVLPQLEPDTWLAGDVRASIALTTYLEDVLTLGIETTETYNTAVAGFLESVAAGDHAFVDAGLAQSARAATAQAHAARAGDVVALEAGQRALRDALDAVVVASRAPGAGERDPAFVASLRETLVIAARAESRLAERTGQLSPF